MATEQNSVEEGFQRLQAAFSAMGEEVEAFQQRFTERQDTLVVDARKRVESLREEMTVASLAARAEQLQQQLEKDLGENEYVNRARQMRADIERDLTDNEWVQRGQALRRTASEQLDQRVDEVLGNFEIARASDVKKLQRKMNQLNRKLKALEKSQAESAPPAAQ